ncbi:MAG: cytidylate kinase-like family protein [Hungatella sp.]|nr:cytidylate kinase-like family protein [Hungatella sp.]MCI9148594.1 cytidylate kinase-like family protein [Hungatella sp.]
MSNTPSLILTISRQYGSGGRAIAARLSKDLSIPYYDKSILRINAEESGLKESYFHLADEKPGDRILYRIINTLRPALTQPSYGSDLISADNLFRFQSAVIRRLAAEESCIIVGRCGDYLLEGTPNLIRIYLYADFEYRVSRITSLGYHPESEVPGIIRRKDKERRDYYRYYTGRGWEQPANYDLSVNTASLGTEGTVSLIKHYIQTKGYGA